MFYKLINTIIMKKIYFFLVAMVVTSMSFGQGNETFDNFPSTNSSYVTGTFTGQDGSTWNHIQSRGDGTITGQTIMIGRNRSPQSEFYSGTISGGVGTISFNYMQAFGTNVNLNVMVNGAVVGNVTSTGEQNVIKPSGNFTVDTAGDVTIKFINVNNGDGQVVIDDVVWTAFAGAGTPSLTISAPTNMAVLPGGTANATISTSTNNFTVDALPGSGGTGDGHIHWTLDTNGGGAVAQPMKYDTNDIILPVVDGSSYVVEMTLVDNAHTPIIPSVSETVTFSVAYPCNLVLGNISTTCETSTDGPANDTYTTTIDFTGGNTSTYTIDTAGNGSVSGQDPSTNTTGQIIITGSTENTDLVLTVTGDAANSSCNIVRNVTSPTCVPTVCEPVGSIIITEIMKDSGAVSDTNGEYFEVYNTTGASIDMQGWVISDAGSDSHTIATSVVVPSMGYAVFGRDETFADNGGVNVNYEYSGIFMSNGADEVQIECSGAMIDAVAYTDGAFPDTAGASMELSTNAYTSVANNEGANWASATSAFGDGDLGTPGTVNDNSAVLGIAENKIEEFKIFPNPTSGNFINITTANNTSKNVQIFDMLGKKVIDQEAAIKLNITALQTGIYIVKITENNLSATKRLIIK